jgi:hypothetical protein
MARKIYITVDISLIPQGDRNVATFPSGLIKVEQTFVGLTSEEAGHRAQLKIGNEFPLDGSPSIDGVFIFPATQETRDINGFTTYKVSGYGRVNDSGYSEISPSTNLIATTIESFGENEYSYFDIWTAKQKITYRVILNDQEDEDPMGYDTSGIPAPVKIRSSGAGTDPTWTAQRVDVQRTNFGRFTELITLAKYRSGTPLF